MCKSHPVCDSEIKETNILQYLEGGYSTNSVVFVSSPLGREKILECVSRYDNKYKKIVKVVILSAY